MINLKESRNFIKIWDNEVTDDTVSKINKIRSRSELIDFCIYSDGRLLYRSTSDDTFDTLKIKVKKYLNNKLIISLDCLFRKYPNLKVY